MFDESIPYIMFEYPISRPGYNEYAEQFCQENNLILGNSYYIKNKDKTFITILVGNNKVDVGIIFFEEHFKKDIRTINLDSLGI